MVRKPSHDEEKGRVQVPAWAGCTVRARGGQAENQLCRGAWVWHGLGNRRNRLRRHEPPA